MQIEKKQSDTLQANITAIGNQYKEIMKNLPTSTDVNNTKKSLCQLIDTAKALNAEADNTKIINYISWGVVAVCMVVVGAVGWISYGAKTQATKAHTAIVQGLYNNDGWSVLQGTQSDTIHQQYNKQKE